MKKNNRILAGADDAHENTHTHTHTDTHMHTSLQALTEGQWSLSWKYKDLIDWLLIHSMIRTGRGAGEQEGSDGKRERKTGRK